MSGIRRFVPRIKVPSFLTFMLFTIVLVPLRTQAQGQPGRILTAPGNNNIVECNVDASNCFTVAGYQEGNINPAAPNSPSIANDGTIAFTALTGPDGTFFNTPNLYLANPDGTNVRQLTFFNSGQNAGNLYPAISPDATMAAFITNVNTTPGGSRPQQVYLVDADGSNFRQLTPFDTAGPDPSQSYFDGMAWSPDSKKLALRGVVYTSACGTYGGGPIYVRIIGAINADGSNFQILACDNNDGYVNSIGWSPDGTLLAWTRNVQHGAQGCSGCVGEPAIAFLDFSGQNRYSSGITSTQLSGASGGDSCQDTACIHFSPDSTMLAYKDTYRDGVYCYGGPCYVSLITLDGATRTETNIQVSGELWWSSGSAIPSPAQVTLAPATLEFWPGFSQQLTPSLLDGNNNLILHSAQVFNTTYAYAPICTLQIGPYGLTTVTMNPGNTSNNATVSATNAGLTSPSLPVKCWYSSPCTYSLTSSSDNFDQNGGQNSVSVTADPGQNASTCPWQASSNASWIMITSPTYGNGSGSGSVSFTVGTNNTGQARQGTITINPAGTFTVYQSAVSSVTLQSITVSPNPASVAAGLTQQFAATGHYSDGSTQDLTLSVTWSSSNTGVATISNTVGSQGLSTGIAAGGPVTITATSGAVSGTAQLTVTAPVLQTITVSPASTSVADGLTQQFTATGHYSDNSSSDVTASATWSSSNTAIATVSAQGLAKGVAVGGPVSITATVGAINGSGSLTVTAPVLSSLAVTPVNPTVVAGNNQQFTATGTYSDGSIQNVTGSVTWSSTNTAVATINASGLATAVAAGSTTISANLGNFSNSTAMNVITLQSVTISPINASVTVGSMVQYSATGHYSDGSIQDLTAVAKWSSSKTAVATITAGGLATGVAKGSTTIKAVVGAFSASTTLTVNAVTLVSISVTPASATISVGMNQQFTATGTYNNGTQKDLTNTASWSASPKGIAKINSSGLATGLKPGIATISAKSGGATGSATLNVQ